MSKRKTTKRRVAGLMIFATVFASVSPVIGKTIVLKNGMEFQGLTDSVPTIGVDVLNPAAVGGNVDVAPVVVIDDGLRRTFVPKKQVVDVRADVETLDRLRLKQGVVKQGKVLGRIGDILNVTPFDDWGKRTHTTISAKGPLNVFQGITEVHPVFTRVEGLKSGLLPYVWDMRIATSSIPRKKLRTILGNHLDEKKPDVRLSIVQFYLQSERYGDAEYELQTAIRDFPDLARLKQELRELRQLRSEQQLKEIKLRQAAGQHLLVADLLERFPDENVAGEILLEVSELKKDYEDKATLGKSLIDKIAEQGETLKDPAKKQAIQSLVEELQFNLSFNTLLRLADYQRLLPDKGLGDEEKLALALSGWLLGGNGTDNIEVAVSLWKVRELVTQYLRSKTPAERKTILANLASLEGGSPRYISKILATMKPPVKTPGAPDPAEWARKNVAAAKAKGDVDNAAKSDKEGSEEASKNDQPATETPPTSGDVADQNGQAAENRPHRPNGKVAGQFRLSVDGVDEKQKIEYVVQLPPEYDPNRSYPAVVTLHAAGATPEMQIAWWAGSYNADLGMRLGQAARRGYIVIAPAWTEHRQKQYKYTAQEHAAALYSLRDSMQRFSIDSDRVFLSGHSMGGDAAWDIGIAHPDVWAGVIPVSAVAEYSGKGAPKYIAQYKENARHVPLYFVGGAFDGNQIDKNSRDWNRYLRHDNFDVTIVEYLGRGHEHFQDEIQRIFKWMELHKRNFFPTDFTVQTMRPWDRFFWWIEADGLPPKSMILPAAWPPRGPIRPTTFKVSISDKKNIIIKKSGGAEHLTVWLSPELVDLDADVKLRAGSIKKTLDTTPSAETMLEDARQRADRLHPFWVKVEVNKVGRGRTP